MARKKYKQTVKDRMAESRGMERYETKKMMKKKMNNRSSDMMHRGVINEDRSAFANMPKDAVMVEYPASFYEFDQSGPNYGDTLRGVDDQMYEDSKVMQKRKMSKY